MNKTRGGGKKKVENEGCNLNQESLESPNPVHF